MEQKGRKECAVIPGIQARNVNQNNGFTRQHNTGNGDHSKFGRRHHLHHRLREYGRDGGRRNGGSDGGGKSEKGKERLALPGT